MIVFVNGRFVEEALASLQIGDLALQRGYAAFDYLRTKNGVPLFLDHYVNRFFHSAERMFLQPVQTKEKVKRIISELIQLNQISESGIRMIFTGGYAPDSYTPVEPNLIITQQKLQLPSEEAFQSGVKVISHQYQRDLPEVKSINYLMGIYLQKQIKSQQAQDVLYYKNGDVSEFPRANVFLITRDNKIVTPSENILQGITRAKLLEMCAGTFVVEKRPVTLDEIKAAPEVFMTSTTKRILPVTQIDEAVIGNGKAGPMATLLNNEFIKMENKLVR